ncbi:MAG: SHOCT domain-containing protein [Bacillota bacterium]|nr:SHOCT domain-containing protein [Bacillota bacterium]
MMILVFLVIGFIAYELLKTSNGTNFIKSRNEDAQEILKKRYVNGEISHEEYDKILKQIK